MNSAEFKALYGVNPTNAEFVTRLYNNVLHRAPEQGGFDYWTGLLDSGTLHKENVMTGSVKVQRIKRKVIGVIQTAWSTSRTVDALLYAANEWRKCVCWDGVLGNLMRSPPEKPLMHTCSVV